MSKLLKILIVVLVVDMIGLGMLWFAYSMMANQKAEEAELQKKLVTETEKSFQLTALRRTVEQAEKESAALEPYFYDGGEESQIKFVADIAALGTITGTGAEIRSFDLAGQSTFRGDLGFAGEWQNEFHLLRLLETFPARLVITNFTTRMLSEGAGAADAWSGSTIVELRSVKNK